MLTIPGLPAAAVPARLRAAWTLSQTVVTSPAASVPAILRAASTIGHTRCTPHATRESDLGGNDTFMRRFTTFLIQAHALTGMEKRTFEEAFAYAAGAQTAQSQVQTGWDVVDSAGVHWSLKTQSDAAANRDYLDITKLSGARWIQTITADSTKDYQQQMQARFAAFAAGFTQSVDRVLVLQCFPDGYQLVEPPVSTLFQWALQLPASVYPESKGGRLAVRCPRDDSLRARIKLDYSDGKVCLLRVPVSTCITHATWRVTAE